MNLPKLLIYSGLFLVGSGVLLWLVLRVPGFHRLGRLPGDLRYEGKNVRIYFPWVTSLLLSLLLTLLLQWLGRFRR